MKVEVAAPKSCPFCRATDVKTASKVVDESTYFRCGKCGEIWNPNRLRLSHTTVRSRPW